MNYIADFLAIAIVAILLLFYIEKKPLLTTPSKFFIGALALTAFTAIIDIVAVYLLDKPGVPVVLNLHLNNLYFFSNILTTSAFALYLFSKILEHVYDRHCFRRGFFVLFAILAVYTTIVILNIPFELLFYFDEQGVYHRGPLNFLGYLTTIVQLGLVIVCYRRNRRYATSILTHSLTQIVPIIVVAIIIQRLNTDIMLNCIIMAFVAFVLFLNFQGQKSGVSNITKLNDRQRFFHDVSTRIEKEHKFQILQITLRNFNLINQKFGYKKGDEILYQFALSLESLNKRASAYHMNGTIFALVLSYKSDEEAEKNLQNILSYLNTGVDFDGDRVKDNYVVVEYLINGKDKNSENFYEKLEYTAAVAHKQSLEYIRYTDEFGQKMLREKYLISRLENISIEEGYEVWFQPVFCLCTERFCSAEALIRLREPDGTLISPAEFIPLAERTGKINKITFFMTEQVARFLNDHKEIGITVSINLPMTQLIEPNFYENFNRIIDENGISHKRICLEFTERAILDDFESTKSAMERLVKDGYRFYLDDFGTGYSNFNCLLQLPFDCIKLDKSMTISNSEANIVSSLTKLFHDMKHTVIAEGAETEEDVSRLMACGVDRIQGYYYAKPMPIKNLLDFYNDKAQ